MTKDRYPYRLIQDNVSGNVTTWEFCICISTCVQLQHRSRASRNVGTGMMLLRW
ncbi:hypothetical protein WN48_01179 [Eufriesea mexicana]|nr:hypothetical protein WN48_01179 [Eufriesea mexicana]